MCYNLKQMFSFNSFSLQTLRSRQPFTGQLVRLGFGLEDTPVPSEKPVAGPCLALPSCWGRRGHSASEGAAGEVERCWGLRAVWVSRPRWLRQIGSVRRGASAHGRRAAGGLAGPSGDALLSPPRSLQKALGNPRAARSQRRLFFFKIKGVIFVL